MTPLPRRLLSFALWSLLLLIILSAAIAASLRSEAVSRYMVVQATQRVAPLLTIGQCQGSLLSGLQLHAIAFHHQGHEFTVETVAVDWNPLALLKGDLHLRRLAATTVAGHSAPSDPAHDSGGPLFEKGPRLPVDVRVDNASVNDLRWTVKGGTHRVRQLRAGLSVEGQQLKLREIEVDLDGIRLNGSGQVALTSPHPFHAEWRWEAQHPEGRLYRGRLKVDGDAAKVGFVHHLFTPLVATTRGEVTWSSTVAGDHRLAFTGSLDGQHLPPMAIQAAGHGNYDQFRIDPLTIDSLGGTVVASGTFVAEGHPQWNLAVKGKGIDPGRLWRLWPGSLEFNAELQGGLVDGAPLLDVSPIEVTGILLEQPFSLSGQLQVVDDTISIEDVRIAAGDNRLMLDGTLSDHSTLRAAFDLADPYRLWTGFRGHVNGTTMIQGDYRRPTLTVSATGTDMGYGDYAVPMVEASVDLDLGNPSRSGGVVHLHDFRVSDRHFDDVIVDWGGDFGSHRVRLSASSPSTSIALGFAGSCARDECEFKVDTATFNLSPYGQWQLQHSTPLLVHPESIRAFDACWHQDQTELCLTSGWDEKTGWVKIGDTDAPALIVMEEMLREIFDKKHLGWDKPGKS